MTAVTWRPAGKLNTYRARIGRYTWVLQLLPIGWMMKNEETDAYGSLFVASVNTDADQARARAVTVASRTA